MASNPDYEARQQIAALRDEVAKLRMEVEKVVPLLSLKVDPASGGGQVVVSGPTAILRIDSLTQSSAKLP